MLQKPEMLVLAGLMLASAQAGNAYAEKTLFDDASDAPSTTVQIARPANLQNFAEPTVVEGDILVGSGLSQRAIGVRADIRVWPDGVVPYHFDPNLSSGVIAVIQTAIDAWNDLAGISLVEINPNDPDSPRDYLDFIPAGGCASWVGRQGGVQTIWTAPSCSSGSMMHEIGHALGLEHEHTRPDRDQHIQINWDNIKKDKLANFDVSKSDKQYYGPYDFSSIMHYGEYFFSANGRATIKALQETPGTLGQRIAPSAGDIAAIAQLYGTDLSLATSVVDIDGETEVSLLITNQSAQGANSLELELRVGSAKLVSSNSDSWTCVNDGSILRCKRDRLTGHSRSSFVLVLDQALSEEDLNIRLRSKTDDHDLTNNVGVFSPAAAQAAQLGSDSPLYSDDVLQGSTGTAFVSHWVLSVLAVSLWRRHSRRRVKPT